MIKIASTEQGNVYAVSEKEVASLIAKGIIEAQKEQSLDVLITEQEAAQMAKTKPQTVSSWSKAGYFIKRGGKGKSAFYLKRDIHDFLIQRKAERIRS